MSQWYTPLIITPKVNQGKYIDEKTDKVITKMCEYHRDLGKALHATPELANMKMMGYASAYPEFEKNDFALWNNRYKKFMDIAGEDVDVFSLHLYDGSGINNSGGRRSGSNSEAIIDIIETYSFIKFNTIKPIAITEYGRLVPNQPGWAKGNGVSNYEPVENSQAVRSQIHLLMNFLERADHLETTIPFNVDTRNANAQYCKSSIWLKNSDGQIELTNRIYLYEMLKSIKGERVRINSDNIDVQTQAFVSGNEVYVLLNNLNDNTQDIDLNLINSEGLNSVDIKSLKIFLDKEPELTESRLQEAPRSISLDYGETVVLCYHFDEAVVFNNTIYSQKYYSLQYLTAINANTKNNFIFNNIKTGHGVATLRLSVGRNHDLSPFPAGNLGEWHKLQYSGDIIRENTIRKHVRNFLELWKFR